MCESTLLGAHVCISHNRKKISLGNVMCSFDFKTVFLYLKMIHTVMLIRDQTRSVAKQVSVAVGWVKIEISLMAQLKGLTAKFKLM